jgi:hypothetical protein
MLADIYNWFAEGFDVADLKGAKALLEELSNRPTIAHSRELLVFWVNKRARGSLDSRSWTGSFLLAGGFPSVALFASVRIREKQILSATSNVGQLGR